MSNTNKVTNSMAVGDANYDLEQRASAQVTKEILGSEELQFLQGSGIITNKSLSTGNVQQAGATITYYDTARLDGQGTDPDGDQYAAAKSRTNRSRTITLGEISESYEIPKAWTIEQQVANSSVGSLKDGMLDQIKDWGQQIILAGMLNQLFGNDATSITTQASSTAFSGSTLDRVTLKNTVPSFSSTYIGNQGAGGVTTPNNITTGNTLTIQDWQDVVRDAMNNTAGQPLFQRFNNGFMFYGLLSYSGLLQMINQAPAAGAASSFSQELYQRMAGGQKIGSLTMFETALVPGVKFILFPDTVIPRATHSNAEVANTRCAALVGKDALDFRVGKAYPGTPTASMLISIDDVTFKNNKMDNYTLRMLLGGKRHQKKGTGAFAATEYDVAVKRIAHYTAN